ncbi:MAG TPA: hypothetical protein VGM17_16285 [Rhizomicrobium sp.]|jgi:hypothetical protein
MTHQMQTILESARGCIRLYPTGAALTCLMIAACAAPAPSDAVQTSDAAIQIVEKACDDKPIPGTRWRAFLEQDGWHVWIAPYAAHDESQADSVAIVSAKDGSAKCGPVVT